MKKRRTREEAIRDPSKVPFIIGGTLYLVERKAADKINSRLGKDIAPNKLADLSNWIVKNGEKIPATQIG